ncbi:MAG: glycosyltransferase [Alphaproteobacteria bacterium]|nr:MAG: glycosyltransferase [Alphaproteobacteria bacterium]
MQKQTKPPPYKDSALPAGHVSEKSIVHARKFLAGVYFVIAAVYFLWRLTIFNPSYPIYSFLFYLSELVGFVWLAINLLSLLHFAPRSSPPVEKGLAVDVYIPTYNEPVSLVRRTAIAALRITYPHETWILDDGNRPEMREMAEELGCRYIARSENKGAKAGNLNHAMKESKGDFIAVFDADFIAAPSFLDRTLGYFTDPKLAFVQTPQEFYNFDSYQHLGDGRANDLWSEHSLFFHAQQRGRDMHNAAMFCGSCAVLRRTALDDVGGFAEATVTEDMHTSTLLHAKGWSSVYHPETLSAGLAPHDAISFQRQRIRWAEGAMQIARLEGLFAGRMNLTPLQRMAYLLHVGNYIEGPRHVFLYIASAVTLVFYISPIKVSFAEWSLFYIPFLLVGLLAYKEFSRGYTKVIKNEIFNMARCPALVRAFPALFSKKHIDFKVTPKVRKKPLPFLFPWFILVINLVALANAGYDEFFGTPRIDGWPILIVVMWCCLGTWLAWQVCKLTRRCNRNRRSFSRFPVDIPVTLKTAKGKAEAVVTELSDRGMSLKPQNAQAALPSGSCRGVIALCGKELPVQILLRPAEAGQKSGGALSWDSQEECDDYEYFMMMDRIGKLEEMKFPDNKTYIAPLARCFQKLRSSPKPA